MLPTVKKKMIEFGSDFHQIDNLFFKKSNLPDLYKDPVFFATGRQSIISLIEHERWKRIWIPAYFCYEVVDSIKQTGIEIAFYNDYPLANDENTIQRINFKEGDVLLRVNYFGLRDFRSNKNISVPVIEDHSHDLLGHWALFSDAEWCIASLRKSLPLAEGGMLWSPKHLKLPIVYRSKENEVIAEKRWKAMGMKRDYLAGVMVEKEEFRKLYLETEELLDTLAPCTLSNYDMDYLGKLNINTWYSAKKKNWRLLRDVGGLNVLLPENDFCNVFSLIILLKNAEERNRVCHCLIKSNIYPAILWNLPEDANDEIKDFSKQMLSIHCDGRYNIKEIENMRSLIIEACQI